MSDKTDAFREKVDVHSDAAAIYNKHLNAMRDEITTKYPADLAPEMIMTVICAIIDGLEADLRELTETFDMYADIVNGGLADLVSVEESPLN